MTAAERVVLVGFGPVGARFAEQLLPEVRAGLIDLTVVGLEPVDAYNRVLVADYAVGATDLETMTVASGEEFTDAGVRMLLGTGVTAIDRTARHVTLATGETLGYDRLVLATGARANVPTLDGVRKVRRDATTLEKYGSTLLSADDPLPAGVTVLRDLADADTVRSVVRDRKRIVVLGAGVLGLEIALAAARGGAAVCVVHHGPTPMPRNLDRGGGSVLATALRRAGVTVIPHSRAEAVGFRTDGDDSTPRFDFLATADGKKIPGDLLLLSCGVSARTDLAILAGLRVGAGILVGPDLRSWSDEDVYAIGDCAQVLEPTEELRLEKVLPGAPSGLIGPGWAQAEWLAERFADDVHRRATDAAPPVERPSIVMLKAEGIDVVAAGDVSPEPWDEEPALCPEHDGGRRSVAQWADPEHGRYVKMVTRSGVLDGFVCVGMPRTAAELAMLFERRSELPSDRSILLRFDGPDSASATAADAFAPTATVCWCNGVTVGRIEESVAGGSTTVACVGKDTRAGTGCGGCKGRIAELLTRFGDPAQVPV